MPTKRRLINKKAYEELVLLENMCVLQGKFYMKPILALDFEKKETFTILIHDLQGKYIESIYGYDYAEIVKEFTKYIQEH
jgi:hypothetical protein